MSLMFRNVMHRSRKILIEQRILEICLKTNDWRKLVVHCTYDQKQSNAASALSSHTKIKNLHNSECNNTNKNNKKLQKKESIIIIIIMSTPTEPIEKKKSCIANIAEKENVGVGLFRIAHLPDDVQAVIQKLNLDKNDDGTLDAGELGVAFKDCKLLCE